MITTMVKELAGVGHRPRWPRWTLVPWPGRFGWGVYFWEDEIVDVVADKQVEGELFARHVTISTSPRRRIRAPKVKRRGRMKVDLTTITPVTITSDGRSCPHIEATADSIRNSITREFVNRLGAEEFLERDMVRLEMLSKQTFKATVPLGGKYGQVIGWEGSCQLEVNAPALWLLKCAGLVGLGSRTAFGFGRIRVSEL
ncbi:MAG: hypothetical protein GVY18_03590 [Bacteroidetes bacterium]|jgi:hypothetical protein|nr:hypothetical protein [Bacteroidota bacterium]